MEAERLRVEAKAMMDQRPADSLAKLDAALKLLPGDSKTSGDWWLAKASLALREARYDDAIQATQSAHSFAGDSPGIRQKLPHYVPELRMNETAKVQMSRSHSTICANDLLRRPAPTRREMLSVLKSPTPHSLHARNQ